MGTSDAVTTRSKDMSKFVKVIVIDDVDGQSPADETLEFGLDGNKYEIDLTTEHANEFRAAVEKFVAVSRKVTVAKATAKRTAKTNGVKTSGQVPEPRAYDPKAVREWVRGKGESIGDRGRLSQKTVNEYLAATASK
jgi:hypothetical protein